MVNVVNKQTVERFMSVILFIAVIISGLELYHILFVMQTRDLSVKKSFFQNFFQFFSFLGKRDNLETKFEREIVRRSLSFQRMVHNQVARRVNKEKKASLGSFANRSAMNSTSEFGDGF